MKHFLLENTKNKIRCQIRWTATLVISDSFRCCSCYSFSQSYFFLRNPTWSTSKVEIWWIFESGEHNFLSRSWYSLAFCLSQITIFFETTHRTGPKLKLIFGSGEHHFRCCCRHSLYFSVLKLQMSANSHMQQFQN